MRRCLKLLLLCVVLIITSGSVYSQKSAIEVGEIGFPDRAWGKQNVPFDITNHSDWLKFVTVETFTEFKGIFTNPERRQLTNFVLSPKESISIHSLVEVPGSYGEFTVWIRVYDVVDTLDDVSLGSLVMEQPFQMRLHLPEALIPYMQEKMTLAPFAGNSRFLDSELPRLLMVLFKEGKSLSEIVVLTKADSAYVYSVVDQLEHLNLLAKIDDGYFPGMPVVNMEEAKETRVLAEKTASGLTDLIEENQPLFEKAVDSLIESGKYSGDKSNFYEGGSILHQPYPLINVMLFWNRLGPFFVTGGEFLNIFYDTEPCHADIKDFHYLVHAGDFYNGHHIYNSSLGSGGKSIHFGDTIPAVFCKQDWHNKGRLKENVDWVYDLTAQSEPHFVDPSIIYAPVDALSAGMEELLTGTLDELTEISLKNGRNKAPIGIRYWFWNLCVSIAVDKMVDSGKLVRPEISQYRIMKK